MQLASHVARYLVFTLLCLMDCNDDKLNSLPPPIFPTNLPLCTDYAPSSKYAPSANVHAADISPTVDRLLHYKSPSKFSNIDKPC